MNKVVLTGRLLRDAELSYIASTATPKMSFSIAVERNYQKDKNNKKVDFINCEQLGKHVENLCQYVTKGKVDRLAFFGGATTEKKTNADTLEFTDFQEVDNDEIPF